MAIDMQETINFLETLAKDIYARKDVVDVQRANLNEQYVSLITQYDALMKAVDVLKRRNN